jgi:hypothetical protein
MTVDPELADERDIQTENSSDWLYNPNIGAVTQFTCKNLRQ